MHVLVTGGAGFIGSHMVKRLHSAGCSLTTIDNLSTGHRDAVLYGDFHRVDLTDREAVREVLTRRQFDVVMHFAAAALVGESARDPAKYYRNNVAGTLNLLDAMVATGTKRLIFSSTAAVFGEAETIPIRESHPKAPLNPYGKSKLVAESALADYDRAYGLKSVCLRYFNAAGADPDGELGERHEPETHLIPLALQAASGRRPHLTVFGDDYDTQDGTCIRDYIHVNDLCEAHWLAMQRLLKGGASQAFNLGNGGGFSVRQVIDAVEAVTGVRVPVEIGQRREGDPARLVADSTLAREQLGWQPAYPGLESIVGHAWKWERRS